MPDSSSSLKTHQSLNDDIKTINHKERANEAAQLFSFENILKCYYQCRKRKRRTINAAKFEINLEEELLKLQNELESRVYKPGRSVCFVVTKPKPREIFAADFRDRIVHHILVGYLEPIWERKFIDQSYACRKNYGTHRALYDLKRYMAKTGRGGYYFQADIQSFFVSLKKSILFEMIKRYVKNPRILWLAELIIFSNPTQNFYLKSRTELLKMIPPRKSLFGVSPEQGLPIGNLTSQFFANVYLNELDQFVKHKLRIKYYLRYVDDFIILAKSAGQLKIWREEIGKFLREKLELELHPKKQILQKINKGINFVGFVAKPDYVLIRRRVVGNLKQKLRGFNQNFGAGSADKIVSVVNSYFGQLKHVNSFGLRQKLWENNFGRPKEFLEPADETFSYFQLIEQLAPLENPKAYAG